MAPWGWLRGPHLVRLPRWPPGIPAPSPGPGDLSQQVHPAGGAGAALPICFDAEGAGTVWPSRRGCPQCPLPRDEEWPRLLLATSQSWKGASQRLCVLSTQGTASAGWIPSALRPIFGGSCREGVVSSLPSEEAGQETGRVAQAGWTRLDPSGSAGASASHLPE